MKDLALRIEQAIIDGSSTTGEIARRLNHPMPSVSAVLCRLAKEGRVARTGRRAQGKRNFPAILWSVVGRVRELEAR